MGTVLTIVPILAASPVAHATTPPLAGPIPVQVSQAREEGLFDLPERSPGLSTSATASVWRIPVILVSYQDSLLRYDREDFDRMLFDASGATPTGSVREYFEWVSGGRLTVTGEVVAKVQVPGTRQFYATQSWGLSSLGTPQNSYGLAREAVRLAPTDINWAQYDLDRDGYVDMLWVVHAGLGGEASADRNNPWSITSRMTQGWRHGTSYVTDDPVPGSTVLMTRIDRFTILPELSPLNRSSISEIGVYCHEFGHALGLPDLYDTSNLQGVSNVGPGNWSLMSSGMWGADGWSPQYPSHLGAWPLQYLGWDRTVRPSRDTTLVLDPIENGGPIVDWCFQGEGTSEHFLIENRQSLSFDRRLPSEGLLIYHIDETIIGQRLRTNSINIGPTPGLWVVEADADSDMVVGRNRGDRFDPFPGGMGRTSMNDDTRPGTRTFSRQVTDLAISGIEPVGDAMRLRLQVRAPGWQPPEDLTGSAFTPLDSYGFARTSAVDAGGIGYVVMGELHGTTPQVILREGDLSWFQPLDVSQSARGAVDPTLAVTPGGDLAIAWSDYRDGSAQIFYRSRVQGAWSAPTRVTNMPGDCLNSAILTREDGSSDIAFRNVISGKSRIFLVRLSHSGEPRSQPIPITEIGEDPGGPGIAAGVDGNLFVLWSDRAVDPPPVWFVRFQPDSGTFGRNYLVPLLPYAMGGLSLVSDPEGFLHVVWQISRPGTSQLYYKRVPSNVETLIDQASVIQNPVVAIDPEGALHVVYERSKGTRMEGRYRSWRRERGWEARSTDLGYPDDRGITRPQPLPTTSGNLIVMFHEHFPDGTHLMVQRRELRTLKRQEVAEPRVVVRRPIVIGPNPLRAGRDLEIALEESISANPPRVELFDVGGRRLAAVDLRKVRGRWTGNLPGDVTGHWPSGIYFARVAGVPSESRRVIVLR